MTLHRCYMCKEKKPRSEFHKDRTQKDGVNSRCIPCGRVYGRSRRTTEKLRLERYGITEEKFQEMWGACGGRCPICLDNMENTSVVVDHDHSCCGEIRGCTLCVRGLLCRRCNLGLGQLRESPQVLDRAAEYLRGVVQ